MCYEEVFKKLEGVKVRVYPISEYGSFWEGPLVQESENWKVDTVKFYVSTVKNISVTENAISIYLKR